MQIRKLSPAVVAQLCACGLLPTERGHRTRCPIWRRQQIGRLRTRIVQLETRIRALRDMVPERCTPDRPWCCAECQSDAFARSARDADRCIRCAAHHERRRA